MQVDVYWIPTGQDRSLGIMARPRGGDWLEDEIRSLLQRGVDVLVSLLTPDEVEELDLREEELASGNLGIQFLSFPIVDRSVPNSTSGAVDFARKISQLLTAGKIVVIHCRAGIGRASLLAAVVLCLEGLTPTDALAEIAAARGCPVPDTVEQRAWVESLFGADVKNAAPFNEPLHSEWKTALVREDR